MNSPLPKEKLCADCGGRDIEWMYFCHRHKVEYCRGCECPYCAGIEVDDIDDYDWASPQDMGAQ